MSERPSPMPVVSTVEEIRGLRRETAGTIALVPTMGALHEGHMALIERGGQVADHVLVSIFVNPEQFAPGEDIQHYPRPVDEDLRRCAAAGVTGVFAPPVEVIYPPGGTAAAVDVPAFTGDLEGRCRPGHFGGVCRVVMKLLNIVQPHYACFGLKDYQQFRVVQAMASDLAIPVDIVEVATVREPDGLAASSRNRYLNPSHRKQAVGLYKALKQGGMMIEAEGETDPEVVEQAMGSVMRAHHLEVDYAALRHPLTLAELDCINGARTDGVAALVAARLGAVRLIDNMRFGRPWSDDSGKANPYSSPP